MLVMNWMSPHLVTVGPDDSMSRAGRLMTEHRIRHLPVLDDGKLVGVVTDRDIKRASASDATTLDAHELAYLLNKVKVREIMTKKPVTAYALDTIEEAALLMLEHRISGLPVVDDEGGVMGMITQDDIFRALINLTGVVHGGVQFALDLPDSPGSIKVAADHIRAFGGRMISILTSKDRVAEGRRKVYIRMSGVDRAKLMELTDLLAQDGVVLYVLDSRNNKKELLALGRVGRAAPRPTA